MQRPFRTALLTALIASSSALGLSACKAGYSLDSESDGEFDGVGGDTDTRSFFGPGSHWELIIDDGDNTFTLNRSADPTTEATVKLEGSVISLDSGFTQLSVEMTDGDDGSSFNTEDEIAMISISDDMVVLAPPGSDEDQLLVLVSADTCPSSNIRGNWVTYKLSGDDSPTRTGNAFFGDYQYSTSSYIGYTSNQFNLTDSYTSVDGDTFTGAACGSGLSIGDDHHQYLGTGDAAVIHTLDADGGSGNDFRVVFEAREITNRSDLEGSYAGLLYNGGKTSGSKAKVVDMECDSAGLCDVTVLTDFVDDTASDTNYEFELDGTPDGIADGFITGTITTDTDSTPNIACMVNIDIHEEGGKFIACVGQSPDSTSSLFNIFAVAR